MAQRVRTVRIYNLIPFLSGNATTIKRIEGKPSRLLAQVRASCEYKDRNQASWSYKIESHCPIPRGHPFRRLVSLFPAGDPLRTLGCWAYGAGNSWITIEEIAWTDGTRIYPQEEHRNWLKQQAKLINR